MSEYIYCKKKAKKRPKLPAGRCYLDYVSVVYIDFEDIDEPVRPVDKTKVREFLNKYIETQLSQIPDEASVTVEVIREVGCKLMYTRYETPEDAQKRIAPYLRKLAKDAADKERKRLEKEKLEAKVEGLKKDLEGRLTEKELKLLAKHIRQSK